MKTPTTDRRAAARFDVVGSLWGVLALPEPATVIEVSSHGLLVEATVSPLLNSVHALRMIVDGAPVSVDAVVRHCDYAYGGRHRIGLEFVTPPTTVLLTLEQLGSDKQIEVVDAGSTRS